MKMLCWIYGKTRQHCIINKNIIENVDIIHIIVEKTLKNIFKLFEYVEKKYINSIIKKVYQINRT